ncbi:MAG: phosphodiesterase [Sphingobacteriaceae bacterium]|nr:phosphodiesterase [Sphingobacteriaceae bacterium]
MKKLVLSLLLVLHVAPLLAQIVAGPMLGYAEMREVGIWMQTQKQTLVHVEFRQAGTQKWLNAGSTITKGETAYTARFVLGQLEPGTTYEYKVFANAKQFGAQTFTFKTQKLWQWREEPPAFRIALGSCHYSSDSAYDRPGESYGGDFQVFDNIAAKKPDMMLWLGDNIYLREADWSSRSGILYRYSHMRKQPYLQKLLATCPQYAIWDDHDFGPNDATGSWAHKDLSLEAFQLFWMNNGQGAAGVPGITTAFQFNDIGFFLLDNRYHRSSERLKDSCSREMLGEAQVKWLIDALKGSNASFKVVAIGSQVLNSEALYENYAQYPCERERLLEAISREGIKNVVFVTGDRHHSELSKLEKNGIVMYDITASPLSSKVGNSRDNEKNRNRVEGSLQLKRGFATLDVRGDRKTRELVLQFNDSNGQLLYEQIIPRQP